MTRPSAADPIAERARVAMERGALGDLAPAPLPLGCTLHAYEPGEERAWTTIQAAADAYDANPIGFGSAFGDDVAEHRARILFARDAEARLVGTAAAWHGGTARPGWGRIHWVAVLPAEQRRGIGRALVTAACQRLHALGHTRAYLVTSAARLDAIRLYAALGFTPDHAAVADRLVWQRIEAAERARGTPLGTSLGTR